MARTKKTAAATAEAPQLSLDEQIKKLYADGILVRDPQLK